MERLKRLVSGGKHCLPLPLVSLRALLEGPRSPYKQALNGSGGPSVHATLVSLFIARSIHYDTRMF